MADKPQEQPEPAAQDDKLEQIVAAGAEAQATGQNPMAAMQNKIEQLNLSEEDIERIASRVSEMVPPSVGEWLRAAGAFDPPPEPIAPPAPPPTAPAEHPGAPVEQPAPAARKTFAERFMGI